jgi:hypothetical protein
MTDLEYTPVPDPLPPTVAELQERIKYLEEEATLAYCKLIDISKLVMDCGFPVYQDNGRTGLQGHGQVYFPPRPRPATSAYLDRLAGQNK